jgi:glyoxylase-like metal-dependent hydrolase (beta-lactamase superfamily II)
MFGSVPRVLWERLCPADALHRIELVSRVLLLRSPSRSVLVDAGCGTKFSPREAALYDLAACDEALPLAWGDLSDVVLTHLHFDHAGGVTAWAGEPDGGPRTARLRCPQARIFVQRANWERARAPGPRERASYLAENVEPLAAGSLHLLDGEASPLPGLSVHVTNGHTRGMQWVRVGDGNGSIVFPADLVPTTAHLHLPFVMGYDMCVETHLAEKLAFLEAAAAERWIVVFAHDPRVAAGRIERGRDGRFCLQEPVSL